MQRRTYRFGDYRFDPSSGSLETDGQSTVLRPKIAELLRVLIESEPDIVSKEDLIARVWPDVTVVDSGLARNINELRKALAREPDAIETIPKRGYRFKVAVQFDNDEAPAPRRWRPKLAAGVVAATLCATVLLFATRLMQTEQPGQPPIDPVQRETAARREFQRGFENWGLWSEQSMNDALIHFRKAGRLDTDLWYGYVGMAESYVGLLLLTGRTDPEWMQWARDAAGRAVQLAPRVAVVHAAAGDVRLIADWDWNGAERSLETALQCNAFNYTAYQRRGILRTLQGRFEEARQDLRKARELQPEQSDAQVFSAWTEFCARDFDRAITLLDSLPANPGKRRQSLRVLAAAYGMKNDFRQARQALQNAGLPALDELTLRTWLDAREGKSEAARSGLVQLRALCNKEKLRYCDTAIIDAALGDSGSAFASLDQGIEQRHWSMLMVPVDPRLEPLRSDARWQSICTRIRNAESQTALRR